jgi:hypothetical protein
MKHIFIIQLILFAFTRCQAQQTPLPEKSTTEISEVLSAGDNKIMFYGRIESFQILGDTVILLKCGEYKRGENRLLVVIKEKDVLRWPSTAELPGECIIVSGYLSTYNGVPAMISGIKTRSSSVSVQDMKVIPHEAVELYQSRIHLDPIYNSIGRKITFLGQISKQSRLNDTLMILSCKEYLATKQTLNILLVGRDPQSLNNIPFKAGMGVSIVGELMMYDGMPTVRCGITNHNYKLVVFSLPDNTSKKVILSDEHKEIQYIKVK